jgi:hypothetical protein
MQILSISAVLVNLGVVLFVTDWIPQEWLGNSVSQRLKVL